MSDQLPNERPVDPAQPEFGFTADARRVARMGKELATLRRVLLLLVEDKPDLLRLLGRPTASETRGPA